ncbi:L-rhamnose mutarotase [Sphingomonas sp. M1-B02]|uniref:L-rhamnose mutarotase n=1 Tax=Sphingomonas sp. M1-B02 TaxID=3114300 RepID=UPI00223FB868|nr:L-rhamnose mutarotase [Sphingomonas sp. S6-11]UZK64684.1 L-rhamnose mutarotase [Sphingomonas sp. S6-11]
MTTTHAFKMQLKPGVVDEYKARHDAIWPELADLLRESGISDYSIFLDEDTLSLFAVLKLADANKRDALPDHPVMRKWWDHMAPLMLVEPGNKPREWSLKPMFHLA